MTIDFDFLTGLIATFSNKPPSLWWPIYWAFASFVGSSGERIEFSWRPPLL
jgi:hypothetical protein